MDPPGSVGTGAPVSAGLPARDGPEVELARGGPEVELEAVE